ncbi:MAG TPA: ribonuclease J [bacterium]|nr:ribonuclease J [bacterium]
MPKNPAGLSIIPMGGFEEIGKNSLVFQFEDEMFLWDTGMGFPTDQMPGIDVVVPDFRYVYERADQLKGIFLTHGHEDHIGALPYFLRHFPNPIEIWGTKLTIGFAQNKCREFQLPCPITWKVFEPREKVQIGNYFSIDPIRVTHSIPDPVAAAISTPYGTVIHTADFKLDSTPLDGRLTDLNAFAEYGSKGVLLFIVDTTNIYRPGMVDSERTVGVRFNSLFEKAKGRIIVASFASHIHRLQQAIEAAARYGRKTAVVGRSMIKNIQTALDLGFLEVDRALLIDARDLDKYNDNELLILCTGSQGEPGSAMGRMARGDHPMVEIKDTDLVIISAHPIPGNEANISRSVNRIFERGANVFFGPNAGVHVSGHANRGEIKLMTNLVKADHVMPYHGENRHFREYAELARKMRYPSDKIIVGGIGDVMSFDKSGGVKFTANPYGGVVLIDGALGEDKGSRLLQERLELAQGGVVLVSVVLDKETHGILDLRIESQGFLLAKDADGLFEQAVAILTESITNLEEDDRGSYEKTKTRIARKLGKLFAKKLQRSPSIMSVIHEV